MLKAKIFISLAIIGGIHQMSDATAASVDGPAGISRVAETVMEWLVPDMSALSRQPVTTLRLPQR